MEIQNYNHFKLDLFACDYELSLYRAKDLHSYGCEMIPVC